MDGSSTEKIEAYKALLMKRAKQRAERLSAAVLDEAARTAGLSKVELGSLSEEGRACVTRGLGYLSRELLDDAIHELTLATLLQPGDLEALHHLSLAYQRRWSIKKKGEDQKEAARLARLCLEIDPNHEPSYDLLKRLEDPHAPKVVPKAPTPNNPAPVVILVALGALIVLVVFGLVVALVLFANSSEEVSEGPSSQRARVAPVVSEDNTNLDPGESLGQGTHTLPVTLKKTKRSKGLGLDPRTSILNIYDDSSFFNLGALLTNGRDTEIDEMDLKIMITNSDSEVISTATIKAPQGYEPTLRPGDAHGFSHLLRTKRDARAVVVEVVNIIESPADSSYDAGEIKALKWDFKQPKGFELTLRERSMNDKPQSFGPKKRFHQASLEVENTGKRTFKFLKVQARYLDKAGEVKGTDQTFVIATHDPELRPGEKRLFVTIETVPLSVVNYEIAVVDIKH